MLYETAARASEVLALDMADLDLDGRRAKVTSKGGATEWVYWSSGTAHLLPRLLRGRNHGPVFLSERRPGPARRPPGRHPCATVIAPLGRRLAAIDFVKVELSLCRLPAYLQPAVSPALHRVNIRPFMGLDYFSVLAQTAAMSTLTKPHPAWAVIRQTHARTTRVGSLLSPPVAEQGLDFVTAHITKTSS